MTLNKMKILFIGTVDFSYSCLEHLIKHNFKLCGVITKKQSKFNSDFKDLTPLCEKNNIPYFFDEKANKQTKEEFIANNSPDIIYCFGWSYLLPQSVLKGAKYGVIGFHPALLPNNRGRHPIIWAIFLGLENTGSTFFEMDEGADTGDIISQREIKITTQDDASSLYAKIKTTALEQIIEFSMRYEKEGKIAQKRSQDKNTGNSWRKRGLIDGRIDFRMCTIAIYNLVRALTHPYVGAHIETEQGDIKVWEVSTAEMEYPINFEPGKVLDILDKNKIVVKTYDGAIILTNHEFLEIPEINTYL
ncbi:formyltransferase family protein [Mesonia ostreae]|uniref:Formyltransferase family protein n=1 Tax=Mesonia ostreae TaxID=861110 RepID=A0ABU2KH90_9FLAO|nr:formyltransferase family protein [Mesonia ostreae]MDT0294072.1 formyltransferase family protein [Mesonia ostreae]